MPHYPTEDRSFDALLHAIGLGEHARRPPKANLADVDGPSTRLGQKALDLFNKRKAAKKAATDAAVEQVEASLKKFASGKERDEALARIKALFGESRTKVRSIPAAPDMGLTITRAKLVEAFANDLLKSVLVRGNEVFSEETALGKSVESIDAAIDATAATAICLLINHIDRHLSTGFAEHIVKGLAITAEERKVD